MDDILLGMGKSCVNYCIHGIVRGLHKFRTCIHTLLIVIILQENKFRSICYLNRKIFITLYHKLIKV